MSTGVYFYLSWDYMAFGKPLFLARWEIVYSFYTESEFPWNELRKHFGCRIGVCLFSSWAKGSLVQIHFQQFKSQTFISRTSLNEEHNVTCSLERADAWLSRCITWTRVEKIAVLIGYLNIHWVKIAFVPHWVSIVYRICVYVWAKDMK